MSSAADLYRKGIRAAIAHVQECSRENALLDARYFVAFLSGYLKTKDPALAAELTAFLEACIACREPVAPPSPSILQEQAH